ncbi:MAG: HAD family hydrolase [Trueperaceae bacterium]|nr:MAG: HAD family hydrolase [Trueperaceae bacterium]
MLLAFDLDKTVVTQDGRLPPAIRQAIHKAREDGHLVTVLTGRPQVSAAPFIRELDLTGPYSVNHGVKVLDTGGNTLRHKRISAREVSRLLETYGRRADLEFSCMLEDTLFVKNPQDARWSWAHTLNRRLEKYNPKRELEADKIVFSANGGSTLLEREISEEHPEFITYLWDDGYLEITGPETDKGAALELIAETLGVPRQQTIAFGDGPNDITMLAWAGRSIAVGPDAHPEVRRVAHEHIPSPEEGGVASWLETNL